jgi:hypothetical protein
MKQLNSLLSYEIHIQIQKMVIWKTLMFASFGDYGYMSVVKKLAEIADLMVFLQFLPVI